MLAYENTTLCVVLWSFLVVLLCLAYIRRSDVPVSVESGTIIVMYSSLTIVWFATLILYAWIYVAWDKGIYMRVSLFGLFLRCTNLMWPWLKRIQSILLIISFTWDFLFPDLWFYYTRPYILYWCSNPYSYIIATWHVACSLLGGPDSLGSVSYTHLTLPTIYSV